MDAAILLTGGSDPGTYNLSGNLISHVGHVGIYWAGDTGQGAFIFGNVISHLGESPMFEQCDGVGAGCLPGNGTGNDTHGIRVTNCAPIDGVVRGRITANTISSLGGGRRGRSSGINLRDCTYGNVVDSNFIHTATASPIGSYGILMNGIPAGQYHHNNLIVNNRFENIDIGFAIDYDTATSQTGRVNKFYNNSCHNPGIHCWAHEDGAGVGGQLLFRNNAASSTLAYRILMEVPASTMWNASFTHNAFDCAFASCSGNVIATIQGVNYLPDADCSGPNCIDTIGSGNVYARLDLEDGTLNLVRETEEEGTEGEDEDVIPKDSQAIDAGVCLPDVPFDWMGTSRPNGPTCDIGANEYIDESLVNALIQTAYRFYGRMATTTANTLAGVNTVPHLHDHSEFNIRFAVVGDSNATSFVPELTLYYQLCSPSCGTYLPITTNCTGTALCLRDNPFREDGSQIGNALPLNGRTPSAESSFFDTNAQGQNYQMDANVHLELEWSLKVGTLADEGDYLNVEMRRLGGEELSRYDERVVIPLGIPMATINGYTP
jgi:hypothetical protein